MSLPRTLIVLLALILAAAAMPGPASGQSSQVRELQRDIEKQKQREQAARRALQELTQEERKAYTRLAETEDEIHRIEAGLKTHENALAEIRKQEQALKGEQEKLEKVIQKTREELKNLLAALWPVHLENIQSRIGKIKSWSEADRYFTWLSAIYRATREKMAKLNKQHAALEENLQAQRAVAARISDKIREINKDKDRLLAGRLEFLKKVQEVRAMRLEGEQQLSHILTTIENLNYQVEMLTSRKIENLKGHIPWPVRGEIEDRFAPNADPPQRGLSISVSENSPVTAVHWGKIVHNDTLRGFGRVVIIYHGDDYYSLYAFLSDTSVKLGQEVEKGEVIGAAGFYPKVNGPGLYFELRFHQKPINPEHWLAKA